MKADLCRAETPSNQPVQKVWLSSRDTRMRLPCKKLSSRYVGHFTIIKQINPVTYKLQLPSQYKIHSSFHVSLLKPSHPPVSVSTEHGPIEEPPLPLNQEDHVIYTVNEILDSWHRGQDHTPTNHNAHHHLSINCTHLFGINTLSKAHTSLHSVSSLVYTEWTLSMLSKQYIDIPTF